MAVEFSEAELRCLSPRTLQDLLQCKQQATPRKRRASSAQRPLLDGLLSPRAADAAAKDAKASRPQAAARAANARGANAARAPAKAKPTRPGGKAAAKATRKAPTARKAKPATRKAAAKAAPRARPVRKPLFKAAKPVARRWVPCAPAPKPGLGLFDTLPQALFHACLQLLDPVERALTGAASRSLKRSLADPKAWASTRLDQRASRFVGYVLCKRWHEGFLVNHYTNDWVDGLRKAKTLAIDFEGFERRPPPARGREYRPRGMEHGAYASDSDDDEATLNRKRQSRAEQRQDRLKRGAARCLVELAGGQSGFCARGVSADVVLALRRRLASLGQFAVHPLDGCEGTFLVTARDQPPNAVDAKEVSLRSTQQAKDYKLYWQTRPYNSLREHERYQPSRTRKWLCKDADLKPEEAQFLSDFGCAAKVWTEDGAKFCLLRPQGWSGGSYSKDQVRGVYTEVLRHLKAKWGFQYEHGVAAVRGPPPPA